MQGLVIRNTGSWYEVRTDGGRVLQCKIKGNFRLRGIRSTNPVAVGDIVDLIENNDGTAFICEIADRRNYIIRRASNLSKQSHILAANIDLVLLFFTINYPETSSVFIDRFLASAEAYRIPVVILFNKTDLLDDGEMERMETFRRLYTSIGYTCYAVSVVKREGLEELPGLLKDKITLVAGNSGVGKSALLNALVPTANAATASISDSHNVGMHTTTFSEMYDLPGGGSIIDIPGVKGFGTFDFEPQEVSHYFREIFNES
ncbi:MAG: ribosome small subunit-dependent GTPase A, partial [Bacteroidaceae bacterium]|nr:ribosome small subunit-dependent GTPase A [Bacteroidaceae bacterium]